jgi:hypothetical protein
MGEIRTAYKACEYNSIYSSYRGIQIPLDTVFKSVLLLSSLLTTTCAVVRAALMKLSFSTVYTVIFLSKLLTKMKCIFLSSHVTKLWWFLPLLLNSCYVSHWTVVQVMCHPYVAGEEASRPVITEVLMYLDELETMTTTDEEIPTPKFALQRDHDSLFVFGDCITVDCYSTRADRWTEVSCTQLHSNSALSSNCKPCHSSGR